MPTTDERLTRIEEMINNLAERWSERWKAIEEVIRNQELLYSEFENLKKETQQMNTKCGKMLNDYTELEKSVHFLQAENVVLKRELTEDSQCKELANKLDVSGIPEENGENLKESMMKIANKVGVTLKVDDIKEIWRVKHKNSVEAKINVSLKNKELRDNLLVKGKKAELTLDDIMVGKNGSNNKKIFFNEVLTSYMKKVFYEARMMKRDSIFKFAWVKNGRVFVRKSENDHVILIKRLEDIATLRK